MPIPSEDRCVNYPGCHEARLPQPGVDDIESTYLPRSSSDFIVLRRPLHQWPTLDQEICFTMSGLLDSN